MSRMNECAFELQVLLCFPFNKLIIFMYGNGTHIYIYTVKYKHVAASMHGQAFPASDS